jgi:hypothetical protein
MSRKDDSINMILDLIKIGAIVIIGYIIIKALLSAL